METRLHTRSHGTLLPGEPRHFPAHPLPGNGHGIFHLYRSSVWRCNLSRQHPADATLYPLLLHHGLIRIRRRSPDRKIHRCPQPHGTAPYRQAPLRLGHRACAYLHPPVRHRRKGFPRTAYQRTDGHRSLIRLFLLGACHPIGRLFGFPARRHLHRSHRYRHHAERHGRGIRRILPHLLRAECLARQSCAMARLCFIPRLARHGAGVAYQASQEQLSFASVSTG